jgi:hypothetical protein
LQQFLLLATAGSESETQSWPFLSHRFDPCGDAVNPLSLSSDPTLRLMFEYSWMLAAVVKKKSCSTQSFAHMLDAKPWRAKTLQLLSGEGKFLRL